MKKGFTLIELLIVIAILAVLATAVVVVLNPAELIKQARDTTRISDLAAINSALSLVLTDQPSLTWTTTSTCASASTGATSTTPIASTTDSAYPNAASCGINTSQVNTGGGWVSVNFTQVTGGSPIAKLPVDPVNSLTSTSCRGGTPSGCFYAYKSSSTQGIYEIDANMESVKYSNNGGGDVVSKDGGNKSDWYEVGSSLTL